MVTKYQSHNGKNKQNYIIIFLISVPHQPRQKRQKKSNFENESSSSDEDQMDGDLEEDDDENSEEQEFDSFDSDTFKQDRTSSNKFEQDHRKSPTDTQQYIPPLPADTSWTSPSSSSNDSGIGIPACDPLLSTLTPTQTNSSSIKFEPVNSSSIKFEPVNSSSIKFEQVQTSPASTETTQQHQNLQHNQLQLLQNKVANSLNNNNDDIFKNEFADFVDLVDSLQGMPDIDFEDNFEMFPIH